MFSASYQRYSYEAEKGGQGDGATELKPRSQITGSKHTSITERHLICFREKLALINQFFLPGLIKPTLGPIDHDNELCQDLIVVMVQFNSFGPRNVATTPGDLQPHFGFFGFSFTIT